MTITDEQIRDACNTLGLSPTGHVPVKPFVGRLAPEPGPLGFAAGHETPGWRYLRCLVDAALAATAKRVKADEPDPDRVIEVLGWRSDRYFEAVVVYLEDVGVVEPENRARVLIRDEQQRQEQS